MLKQPALTDLAERSPRGTIHASGNFYCTFVDQVPDELQCV